MNKQPHVIWIMCVVALFAGIASAWLLDAMTEPEPTQKTLPITLLDTQDKAHRLDAWKGNVVVFNYWATWCPPCVEEVPMLVSFQNDYASQGVQIVSIAVDQKTAVTQFAHEYHINYPILMAGTLMPQLSTLMGNTVGALPFTAIANREGVIVKRFMGAITHQQLLEAVTPLL